MLEISLLLVVVIVVALVFDFTNGAHDTANAIATVVSTKVLSPAIAVMMAALLNLIGAFIGTHVAQTVGSGIVHPDMIKGCQALTLAALCGAIVLEPLDLVPGVAVFFLPCPHWRVDRRDPRL